jgi:hypothetical protein
MLQWDMANAEQQQQSSHAVICNFLKLWKTQLFCKSNKTGTTQQWQMYIYVIVESDEKIMKQHSHYN